VEELLYLARWLKSVFWRWQSWAGGTGVGGSVGVFISLWERVTHKTMDTQMYLSIVVGGFLFGAFFLAWRDEHIKRLNLEHPPEDPHSLRRRTFALAKELETFSRDRERGRVSILGSPTPEEHHRKNYEHGLETQSLYSVQFRQRFNGVMQELRGKGLVPDTVRWSFEAMGQCPSIEELHLMRGMASRLDHKDDVIHI
jgi:hypothetical protein